MAASASRKKIAAATLIFQAARSIDAACAGDIARLLARRHERMERVAAWR
jgi:hypothetical protein